MFANNRQLLHRLSRRLKIQRQDIKPEVRVLIIVLVKDNLDQFIRSFQRAHRNTEYILPGKKRQAMLENFVWRIINDFCTVEQVKTLEAIYLRSKLKLARSVQTKEEPSSQMSKHNC